MSERRQHPRFRDRRKVKVFLSSGKEVTVWSHDLSLGGIRVLSDSSADIDDLFRIQFTITAKSPATVQHIDARARVAHVVFDGSKGQFRLGLEYVEFNGDGMDVYAAYIDSLVSQYYRR